MMAVGFGQAFAQEESVTFSEQGYTNGEKVSSYQGTNLSIAFADGSTATAYYNTGTGIRLYGGGSATFTVPNATITSVALTFSANSYAPTSTDVWSCETGSGSGTSGVNATWTGSASSVTIARPTGGGHWRLQSVTVTYTAGGSSSAVETTTTIDATGITNTDVYAGTAAGKLSATVVDEDENAVEGATVTWSGNNDKVATIDASTGAVTLVGAGTVTFTAIYAGVQDEYTSSSNTYVLTVTDSAPYTGGDVTFDATADMGTSPLEKNGVTFTCSNGVLNNGSEYRLYKNSETTFSLPDNIISQGFVIQKVEFTGTGSNPASGFAEQEGWTTDGYNGTWTGAATSVSFTASGAQVRATKIKVFVSNTATPTFSVEEGEYSEAKSIEISCATDGASIFYTTDGSTPTNSSTAYSSAILITESTTLKAIAIKDEVESAVASATYIMNRPAAPTFDVAEGVFDAAFDLHLSTETDDATIYYTTDKSTPTISSTEYSTKIAISSTTTVKAIAVKDGLTSDVASATYTYDSRTTPTFTLSTTSVELKVNETSSAVTLTTNSDATPSFTCEDNHVTLTGKGNSRTISANAAGEYTVNVSISGSATYKDAAGTITVTVTKKATTMVLTPSFTSKDLYVTTTGSITGVPQYNSSDIDGAEVTYSSSDTKVATIAYDGTITFKKAGSTTITASYAGNDEYDNCEASYVLELTDTTPQATEVDITLNNTFFGCESFTNWTTGMATTLSESHKNITITYSKGASSNMYCSTEKVRFYTDNTFTIVAPAGYNIISVDMNVSISSADPEGAISSDTWIGDANSVSFTFANKTDISSITVTIAPIVTVSAAGYATYASDHALDFTDSNIKAYIAKAKNDGSGVTFERKYKIPAGTGVLLYKDGGATEAIPVFDPDKEDADNTDGNVFVRGEGVAVASVVGNMYNYILNKVNNVVGFYKAAGQKVAKNRAYIQVESASFAKDFISMPGFDDSTTGVTEVNGSGLMVNGPVYDLQGRRVEKPGKGLYIVNGKKVLKY